MERKIEDYNNSLTNIMNLMSITRKYKVVGSANLRTSEFIQDYDIDGMFKTKGNEQKILDSLTAKFKDIFKISHKNPALFITDFKAGTDPSYPEDDDRFKLRWNKDDMKKGYKILGNGEKKFFRDCLMDKVRMKLDMVYLLDGEYVELSEIYRLNINERKNYDDANIVEELKHEIVKYKKEGNYYKMYKREFSLLRHQGKTKKRQIQLINLFNGQAGLLNNLINQLKIIQNVCIQTFRKVKLDDVRNNLQSIKFKLSSVYEIYHPNFSNTIDSICKKPLSKIYDSLTPIIDNIEKKLNNYVKYI